MPKAKSYRRNIEQIHALVDDIDHASECPTDAHWYHTLPAVAIMMASGLQTAKRELRKKIRDVLQKTPNESIVHQCQTHLLSPFASTVS
jgi:hypothetical protein